MAKWYENFKYRISCKLKREPREDDFIYSPVGVNQTNFCLVEMDSKTLIPFKSWERDGVFYILPAYWPKEKELYIYYNDVALQEWFENLAYFSPSSFTEIQKENVEILL